MEGLPRPKRAMHCAALLIAAFAAVPAVAVAQSRVDRLSDQPTGPASRFEERLASSLLVFVPADAVPKPDFAPATAPGNHNGRMPTVFANQTVPRSSLVAALLSSNTAGLGNAAANGNGNGRGPGENPGQGHGHGAASPNRPPGVPPGPPNGVPPGPPEGRPK